MKPLQTIYWLRLALGVTAALICVGYGLATGTIYKNLILNPSVEMAETGAVTPQYWFPSTTGAEWSTTYSRTESRSIRINVSNASAEWKSNVIRVYEGYTYQVQGFFKGAITTDQFHLTVRWFSDSDGLNLIAENDMQMPLGDHVQWSLMGSAFAAPARTRSCEIVFRAVNGTGDMYGDDFEVRQTESLTKLMNGLSLAIITYILSYYIIIKRKFMLKVEKPQKTFTTGIGIYFIAWLVFWILLYTTIAGI